MIMATWPCPGNIDSPWESPIQKEKVVFQPPFDRIYASWREGNDDFYMSEA